MYHNHKNNSLFKLFELIHKRSIKLIRNKQKKKEGNKKKLKINKIDKQTKLITK